MERFFVDQPRGVDLSWDQLLERLAQPRRYSRLCAADSFEQVVEHIVFSLLCSEPIVLIDHDMSADERAALLADAAIDEELRTILLPRFASKEDCINALCAPGSNWSITLFTSGTTGRPKRVTHSFASITRAVRRSERHRSDIWALAYNATHMAGIQVIMQALLNGNTFVRLFGLDAASVVEQIRAYEITNISATPTFYRLLLGQKASCPSITRLTSGGEAFDATTIERLRQIFPNAKITNVYASTEFGTLFAAEGRDFVVKSGLENKVRVEENELLVHRSLLGESMAIEGEWYHTGDIVELQQEFPLTVRFVSRKSDMINVGGYKVNPSEVEDVLRLHPLVQEVRVYAKSNSVMGNIVCADIRRASEELSEAELRAFTKDHLQEFKVPRVMRFVTELVTTRSGKLKRI